MPSGYQCACVAPGGEAWVPAPQVRTKCAKLAEYIEYPIMGDSQDGTKICRALAEVVGGQVKKGSGKPYYGYIWLNNCNFVMPDGPNPCSSAQWAMDEQYDLLCEQLV